MHSTMVGEWDDLFAISDSDSADNNSDKKTYSGILPTGELILAWDM